MVSTGDVFSLAGVRPPVHPWVYSVMDWLRSRVAWLAQRLDLERAVSYAILTRGWQTAAGLATTLLVAACFTPELQGYYYTLSTLIALQNLVDLGLQWVILHFASHEWSALRLDEAGRVVGEETARGRLVALAALSRRWFALAALVFMLAVGAAGWWLFHQRPGTVAWQAPWLILVVLSGATVALSPWIAVLEGCGQMTTVNALRLVQAVTGSLVVWSAILSGGGLWTTVAAAGVQLACELWLVWRRYRAFWRSLDFRSAAQLDWRRELWPLQWRIGIQSVFRYAAFYLFTPVMFHFHGAAVAGQMGMTWGILSNLQLAAFSWIRTRAPQFGTLVARRQYHELDRLFRRTMWISTLVLAAALLAVTGLIGGLAASGAPRLEGLAARFLRPQVTAVLAVGILLLHGAQGFGVYIRAHKQDPLVGLTLAANAAIGLGVCWFGGQYGPQAAAAVFAIVVTTVTLPGTWWLWHTGRLRWRQPPGPT